MYTQGIAFRSWTVVDRPEDTFQLSCIFAYKNFIDERYVLSIGKYYREFFICGGKDIVYTVTCPINLLNIFHAKFFSIILNCEGKRR